MEEISLREIFFLLSKHKKLIIISTVIFTLLGLGFSLVKSYEYEAFTTLMVIRPQTEKTEVVNDSQELQKEQRFIATCIDILRSRSIYDQLVRNLEIEDLEFKDYQENVSVYQTSSAPIIRITVKNESPELAVSIANELSTLFINNVGRYLEVESISLIDKAIEPKEPIEKNTVLNLAIGAILGIMIGIFASFAIEYFNDTIKTPIEVNNYLSLPVIATIPSGKTTKNKENTNQKILESFRLMKTNIKYGNNKDLKSYVITSAMEEEGKSYIAFNLAKSLSNSKEKVLLVDFNMKHPSLSEQFNFKDKLGIADFLLDKVQAENLLFSNVLSDNLYFIPIGKIQNVNSLELLNTDKIKSFMELAKENFDKVIIDTPASSFVADGLELAALSDGTIIVVGVNETKLELAKHTVDLLNNVKANIVGVALNKIPLEEEKFYGYSYLYLKDYS
ncbi:MAG: polysaccharide biosynthesis tyrosine autokinase [Tissierellales bacterium]|nr:polysaccharide biosynthesis tyrosine autokinase [Tissierellales bacterium]